MATSKYFNNKLRKLPGAYSKITSGVQNPPQTADFSRVLLIDTGTGAGYGGGSGVAGEFFQNKDTVYQFNNVQEAKAYYKGGILWKTVEGLFIPDGAQPGISTLYAIKAATTVAASLTFTAVGGAANGGTFIVKPLDEGLIGNGTLDAGNNDNLIKGYAYTVETGVIDTAKWIFKLWVGSYTGDYTDSISYGEDLQSDSNPILLVQSPEFDNIQELLDWAATDFAFSQYFRLDPTSAVAGDGSIDAADVSAVAGYNVGVGGTETYGTTDLTAALEAVKDLNYTHILSDKYGSSDYNGAIVGAIKAHIETDAKFLKYMFYGGGKDATEFSSASGSLAQALYFNSNQVLVVHGDALKASNKAATGFRQWVTLYKAAVVLGRIAGLQPQVPGTFKSIGIEGEVHNLTEQEKEQALDAGVLATIFDGDFSYFSILQAVNTLQNNANLINADGTSFSHQLERIKSQLNKDIEVNAKVQLLGQPNGVNRNTLSANFVKNWTESFLETKRATASEDNLIIDYQNVVVTRVEDYYEVSYEFIPNTEITKIFFEGILKDSFSI
jgi:hypothetical protein